MRRYGSSPARSALAARHQNSKSLGTRALEIDQQEYAPAATAINTATASRVRQSGVVRSLSMGEADDPASECRADASGVAISRLRRPTLREVSGSEYPS